MSLSLYEITVPVMIAGFGNMSKFLDRGRAFADEKGIAHIKLLNARLADDMMSLVEQVQRASDTARRAPFEWAWLTTLRCRITKQPSRSAGANPRDSLFFSQRCRRPHSNDRQTPSWSFSSPVDSGFSLVAAIYWASRFRTSSSMLRQRMTCFATWVCPSANGTFSVGAELGPAAIVARRLTDDWV